MLNNFGIKISRNPPSLSLRFQLFGPNTENVEHRCFGAVPPFPSPTLTLCEMLAGVASGSGVPAGGGAHGRQAQDHRLLLQRLSGHELAPQGAGRRAVSTHHTPRFPAITCTTFEVV